MKSRQRCPAIGPFHRWAIIGAVVIVGVYLAVALIMPIVAAIIGCAVAR